MDVEDSGQQQYVLDEIDASAQRLSRDTALRRVERREHEVNGKDAQECGIDALDAPPDKLGVVAVLPDRPAVDQIAAQDEKEIDAREPYGSYKLRDGEAVGMRREPGLEERVIMDEEDEQHGKAAQPLHRQIAIRAIDIAQLVNPRQSLANSHNLLSKFKQGWKGKDEGGRMKDERNAFHSSLLLLHPSSFRLHPCSQKSV